MKNLETIIKKYDPCLEAVDYIKTQKNLKQAWNNCPRGDWMLWIASNLRVNIRTLTLAKGYCAKTIIHLMKDERSINAVKTAIRFGRYKTDSKELKTAYADAYAAATAADAYAYAADAAYAAAYADAAYAAADAAVAADAYAAYAAARKKNRLETTNICRKYLTKSVMSKIEKL